MPSAPPSLETILAETITQFQDASARHKRMYRRGQSAIIVMTALTTIAAGAGIVAPSEAWKPRLQFVVLLLSATTAAVTAWIELRKPRDLWQHERGVYHALLDLQRELRFESSLTPLSEETHRRYFARLHEVLQSSGSKWQGIHAKRE